MSELAPYAAQLLDKTNERKIEWTEEAKNTFVTEVGGITVQVRYRTFVTGSPDYRIAITNNAGQEIGAYFQERGNEDYTLLRTLYTAAKRSALKADETLAKLSKALKDL
jgi:hypothetical protein